MSAASRTAVGHPDVTESLDDHEHSALALIVEGQRVAFVDVSEESDNGTVDISFRVAAGHLPMSVRRDLVDAAFDLPELRHCHDLRISMPLGDAQLLSALRSHCDALNAHAAGATCLIEATPQDAEDGGVQDDVPSRSSYVTRDEGPCSTGLSSPGSGAVRLCAARLEQQE